MTSKQEIEKLDAEVTALTLRAEEAEKQRDEVQAELDWLKEKLRGGVGE